MSLMRRKRVFLSVIVVILLAAVMVPRGNAYALSEDASYNTIAVENILEEKLRSAITEVLGSDSVIVLVNADVKTAEGETRKQDAVLLPGVPVRKEAGSDTSSIKTTMGKAVIKRLGITILVDTGVSEATREVLRDVATNVAGINKARGDELTIRPIKFTGKGLSPTSLASPTNVSIILLALTGGFFLVIAALFLRNPFNKLGEALKGMGWGGGGGGAGNAQPEKSIEVQNVFTGSAPGAGGGGAAEQQLTTGAPAPFSFVQERHLDDLAFLLKDKSAQDAAMVMNFINPEMANKLLGYFPEERQIDVVLSLHTVDINPEKTRALEEGIKENLEYVVGGERKLVALLDSADEGVREKIIARIEKKDAATARRLRQQIRDFDSYLRDMPASGISVLYRQVDPTLFAQLLKTMTEDIQQKVFGGLSAGASERLKQEIDMGRSLNPARLKKEKRNIAALIRRLIKEGTLEMENS